ncbi:hypothetical protein H0H92_003834, partial [Tricholoma furcatifolium]
MPTKPRPLSKSSDDNKPLPDVPIDPKTFKAFRHFEEAPIEVRAFQGFRDFELDLTCLSPPPSPPPSVYRDATPSPRNSTSLRSPSPALSRKSHTKSISSIVPTGENPAVRGSWPLARYVGRGTPIDKGRRMEWSATSTECGDVGEDGVLVRTTSYEPPPKGSSTPEWKYNILDNLLDRPPSARPPSKREWHTQPSSKHAPSPEWKYNILDNLLDRPPSARPLPKRAASPDWNLNVLDNLLDRPPSTLPKRSRSLDICANVPPPSLAIEIEGAGKPEEWSSFMQTILGDSSPSTQAPTPQSFHSPVTAAKRTPSLLPTHEAVEPVMTPEEMRELDTGLNIDLGIYSALDLGLGEGIRPQDDDANWLHPDMLPDPTSGRDSPSVYSLQAPSTQASRAPSVVTTTQDAKSTASVKTEEETVKSLKAKSTASSQVWWRRVL